MFSITTYCNKIFLLVLNMNESIFLNSLQSRMVGTHFHVRILHCQLNTKQVTDESYS